MEDLKLVSIPELVDLLAQQTARYTKMLSSGANHDDFEICKDKIKQLQQEIASRRENKDHAG